MGYMDWISMGGFVDAPEPKDGFFTEVKRDSFLGVVTHYRHLTCRPVTGDEASHLDLIDVEQTLDARAWTDRCDTKCRHCNGKGRQPGDQEGAPIEDCDYCGGSGEGAVAGKMKLFGHWSKHRLADGVFLPLVCYVPEGPDYTSVPLYAPASFVAPKMVKP